MTLFLKYEKLFNWLNFEKPTLFCKIENIIYLSIVQTI